MDGLVVASHGRLLQRLSSAHPVRKDPHPTPPPIPLSPAGDCAHACRARRARGPGARNPPTDVGRRVSDPARRRRRLYGPAKELAGAGAGVFTVSEFSLLRHPGSERPPARHMAWPRRGIHVYIHTRIRSHTHKGERREPPRVHAMCTRIPLAVRARISIRQLWAKAGWDRSRQCGIYTLWNTHTPIVH